MNEKLINNAKSLVEIDELVAKCTRCLLYQTKNCDVPGKGHPNAEIMFIGEAPGKKEDLIGEPFVGAAGKFLDELLATIGLERKDIFIANVVKHRPPENRDPKPEEAEACWPYLKKQIELINPKLIVFLGRHSMKRFFPVYKISDVHGNQFTKDFWGREQTFLALYHPAAALYNGGMRETLKNDFSKIPNILKEINNK